MSRLIRLARNDILLPSKCFNRWWYPKETCKCENICKYTQLSKKEWEDLANESYKQLYPKLVYSKWTIKSPKEN